MFLALIVLPIKPTHTRASGLVFQERHVIYYKIVPGHNYRVMSRDDILHDFN
jgi:hypothetical protein